jgi:hypothetical protein
MARSTRFGTIGRKSCIKKKMMTERIYIVVVVLVWNMATLDNTSIANAKKV